MPTSKPGGTHYGVSASMVEARPLLAVRARVSQQELAQQIPALLGRVYQGVPSRELLDGQNVVVYRGTAPLLDVEAGVGLRGTLTPPEGLVVTSTPAGEAAHSTHWGDYAGIGRAHQAVIAWCISNERALAGPSWEVYGHWSDDPAEVRTDVYYLLVPQGQRPG
ncbi:MAG TPA: GyrI-like domain-containing protein [Gemmatimonadales bacterium]|nr:GyrI-like domain-containing protein [Gemmatimonadales bacterium]